MHHHRKPSLPNDDIDIFLRRDEHGAIIPVDRYGRRIAGVRATSTTYEVNDSSTITIELYHCGWLEDQ